MTKRKSFKIIILTIIVALLLLSTIGVVLAESAGYMTDYVFFPDGSDLFSNFKGVMPGDELVQDIRLVNMHYKKLTYKTFIRAETPDEQYIPFLEQLNLKVEQLDANGNATNVLFDGKPSETGPLNSDVFLAELAPLKATELRVSLSVPKTLGNEYQNTTGAIKWYFSAYERTGSSEPDTPGTPTTGTFGPPLIFIIILLAAACTLLSIAVIRGRKKV